MEEVLNTAFTKQELKQKRKVLRVEDQQNKSEGKKDNCLTSLSRESRTTAYYYRNLVTYTPTEHMLTKIWKRLLTTIGKGQIWVA